MRFLKITFFLTGHLLYCLSGYGQSSVDEKYKGHIILCGGVGFPSEAIQKFVEFAGGPTANYIFVASASTSIRLDNGFIYDIPLQEADSSDQLRKKFAGELAKPIWRKCNYSH